MDLESVLLAVNKVAGKYKIKPDQVRWHAQKEDGTEVNKNKDGTAICYSTAMSVLPYLEIQCFPSSKSETPMPTLWYHHFFRLLKRSGLVPPEVKTLHREGENRMIIPRNGWDRHTLYITLCYYRFCDLRPNEVMTMMLFYKRLSPLGTTFLQCLHYGATVSGLGSGHCFMGFGAYGGGIEAKDLANGQALVWFAGLSKEERLKIYPAEDNSRHNSDKYTYVLLAKKAKEMESLKVEELVDILDPKHACLYERTKLDGN